VAPADLARDLRIWSPPWPVGLPGQLAAVRALRDPGYYADRWRETARLRADLAARLRERCDAEVFESVANFVLLRTPAVGSAAAVRQHCESAGVFVRDVSPLSPDFHGRYLRIAVKDADLNVRVADAVAAAVRR